MAKAYREGKTWSFRLRLKGQDIYRTGFPNEAAANQAQAEILQASKQSALSSGSGPFCTTLVRAFMQYAKERLPSLKGADKDANRINQYLRPLGLPTIQVESLDAAAGASIYWTVSFASKTERAIPNSLKKTSCDVGGAILRESTATCGAGEHEYVRCDLSSCPATSLMR